MIDAPLLRVMFACRGSTREGLGHVMRSRSVAAEMARLSSTRVCVVGEPYVETLVSGRGLHFQMLKEESELIKQTEAFQPHVVVFDALNFEPETLAGIRKKAMTVSLSPVFNLLNEMDLVFHRTKYLGDEWIPSRRQGPEIRAGLQYAVIREQCVTIGPERIATRLNNNLWPLLFRWAVRMRETRPSRRFAPFNRFIDPCSSGSCWEKVTAIPMKNWWIAFGRIGNTKSFLRKQAIRCGV